MKKIKLAPVQGQFTTRQDQPSVMSKERSDQTIDEIKPYVVLMKRHKIKVKLHCMKSSISKPTLNRSTKLASIKSVTNPTRILTFSISLL